MLSFRLLNEDSVLKTSKISFWTKFHNKLWWELSLYQDTEIAFLLPKTNCWCEFYSNLRKNSWQKHCLLEPPGWLHIKKAEVNWPCKQKHHWSDPLTRCDFVFPLQVKIKFKNCCLYAADSSAGSVSEVNKEATLKGRSAKFKSGMCWLLRVKWRSFFPPLLLHWL